VNSPHVSLKQDRLAIREIDERAVILDLETSRYLQVNETGTLLLRLLRAGTSRQGLVHALQADFDLEQEQAATDVEAFLTSLADLDLIEG
jgi:hypothetical protein